MKSLKGTKVFKENKFEGVWIQFEASNFEYYYRRPPFMKVAIFSNEVLVSNYRGCKGLATKLISYYTIDIIYKTLKISHSKKL